MKLSGFIAEVGPAKTGVARATGKDWICRSLSLLIPFYTERGEERYDNIVADFFGDTPDAELRAMVDNKTPLTFNVAFSTHSYNGRRYQQANVFNLAVKM